MRGKKSNESAEEKGKEKEEIEEAGKLWNGKETGKKTEKIIRKKER